MILLLLGSILVYIQFEPKLDWNYETKQLLLWYSINGQRKYLALW